jgi:hypothetical protein
VSFFEPPPPPPEPEEHRQPAWIGPPENVLPASFPLSLTLAQTDAVAIAVEAALAYRNGFTFRFVLVRRKAVDVPSGDPFHGWRRTRGGEIADDALRFGIQFADGAKATVFDAFRWYGSEEAPEGPVLMQRGGSGGGRTWEFGFWVWPLPPEGPLAFVIEWPAEGIELTRHEIDASVIRNAAAQAEMLWPDDDERPGGAGTGSFTQIGR